MKAVTIALGLSCLILGSLAAVPLTLPLPSNAPAGNAIAPVTAAPPPTLALDFEELLQFIPSHMMMKLVYRYLINDAEFQAVVRTINSYDAFIVRMRFQSQPEVIMFQSWVRQQLLLSGGSFELEMESMEMNVFSMSPYWSNSVFGWQGFLNEFVTYYPQELIRAHIDMKVAQNGIFAQFWARLNALKPVYERVLLYPETQRLIAQLQSIGVDTNQLDLFIRNQFGWLNIPTTAAAPVGGAVGAPANPAVPATVG